MRQDELHSRAAFELQELREMRQARATMIGTGLRWGTFAVVPVALAAWGIAIFLAPLARAIHADWLAPAGWVPLAVGAVCGFLGAAAAGILCDTVLHEDRDVPVIVLGAATLCSIIGGIYGAGSGMVSAVAGTVAAAVLGILAGTAALVLYWAGREVYLWVRQGLKGH